MRASLRRGRGHRHEETLLLPGAAQHLATLARLGVHVRHGVDATCLGAAQPALPRFERIRWNNPHSGSFPSGAQHGQSFPNSGNWFHSTRHSTADLFNAQRTADLFNARRIEQFSR